MGLRCQDDSVQKLDMTICGICGKYVASANDLPEGGVVYHYECAYARLELQREHVRKAYSHDR